MIGTTKVWLKHYTIFLKVKTGLHVSILFYKYIAAVRILYYWVTKIKLWSSEAELLIKCLIIHLQGQRLKIKGTYMSILLMCAAFSYQHNIANWHVRRLL